MSDKTVIKVIYSIAHTIEDQHIRGMSGFDNCDDCTDINIAFAVAIVDKLLDIVELKEIPNKE
jgi:hypothetical protein